ncbi:MAG: hypothetical protein Q8M03_14225, partial [Legionella sp.]|nr:hypothetical protein [Legionella sp.]
TLRDLLEFKATIPAFNTFIQNSPLVSTFINEEHLKRRIALKKYQNAIYASDFNSAEEHLTVALSDFDLGVICQFLYTSDFLKKYNQQFPVGANLLKMLAEDTNEKTACFHFWEFSLKKDFARAASYFALATANNTPEITSLFIMDCIVRSVELADTENSLGSLLALDTHSSEYHQFIMTYKGYWPHLEQAVHDKNKKSVKVAESEPWWTSSFCL